MISRSLAAAGALIMLWTAPLIADKVPLVSEDLSVEMAPQEYRFTNWAGYAAETDMRSPQSGSVTAVGGSWIVPTITPSTGFSLTAPAVAAWVGMDGLNVNGVVSNTVEQIGTDSYFYNGRARYYAWYEMYPALPQQIYGNQITVSGGDRMTASVQYNLPGYPNQFLLTLTDDTTGKSFSISQSASVSSPALRTSADWIAEATTNSQGIVPLPTFGSVVFTNAWATIGSTTGAIDDSTWQAAKLDMVNGSDAMTPSGLTTDTSGAFATSSFTVVQQVPEPSTLVALASAAAVSSLGGLVGRQRRRKNCQFSGKNVAQ